MSRRRGRKVRRAGLLLCLLGALARPGPADGAPEGDIQYGPVPPSILVVQVTDVDRKLATSALDALVKPPERSIREGGHNPSRALLVMLGNAGLHEVAQRLAAGDVPAHARPHLLQVIAASAHPGADLLLARAAQERRPVLRMLAADGLGRGRTPQAVGVLSTLARDPVPAVRAAAMRSLFVIESDAPVAKRTIAPAMLATRMISIRV